MLIYNPVSGNVIHMDVLATKLPQNATTLSTCFKNPHAMLAPYISTESTIWDRAVLKQPSRNLNGSYFRLYKFFYDLCHFSSRKLHIWIFARYSLQKNKSMTQDYLQNFWNDLVVSAV